MLSVNNRAGLARSHGWFQMRVAAADPTVAELFVNDYIGDWFDQAAKEWSGSKSPITAKQFIDELSALPDDVETIRCHINSPGGDVAAALMIANALRDQRVTRGRTVETIVDGLAASSASIIAMAGSPVIMADNAILMIHNPWAITLGNSEEMRKTADVLDQIRDANIIPTYRWHTKLSAEKIAELMAAETWMDSDESLAHGFADKVVQGLQAAASIDPRTIAALRVPGRFEDRVRAFLRPEAPPIPAPAPPALGPMPASADRVHAACFEASLDLEFARTAIAARVTPEALAERIAAEKQLRAAAAARAVNIRALFKGGGSHMAPLADMAEEWIATGWTFDQVKLNLCRLAAKLDKVEIDAGLAPSNGAAKKPAMSISEIYAEYNKTHQETRG